MTGEKTMQTINPVDPIMLLLYGLIIGAIFLIYAFGVRKSGSRTSNNRGISSMAGGKIEEITTGAVQESMPAHLVSIEEEEEEYEGEDLSKAGIHTSKSQYQTLQKTSQPS